MEPTNTNFTYQQLYNTPPVAPFEQASDPEEQVKKEKDQQPAGKEKNSTNFLADQGALDIRREANLGLERIRLMKSTGCSAAAIQAEANKTLNLMRYMQSQHAAQALQRKEQIAAFQRKITTFDPKQEAYDGLVHKMREHFDDAIVKQTFAGLREHVIPTAAAPLEASVNIAKRDGDLKENVSHVAGEGIVHGSLALAHPYLAAAAEVAKPLGDLADHYAETHEMTVSPPRAVILTPNPHFPSPSNQSYYPSQSDMAIALTVKGAQNLRDGVLALEGAASRSVHAYLDGMSEEVRTMQQMLKEPGPTNIQPRLDFRSPTNGNEPGNN